MFLIARRPLSGTGAVRRPDGRLVEDVAYVLTTHTRAAQADATRRCTARLRVDRQEALYWFFECRDGLHLEIDDGRVLQFALTHIPDQSHWVEVTAARLPWAGWRWPASPHPRASISPRM